MDLKFYWPSSLLLLLLLLILTLDISNIVTAIDDDSEFDIKPDFNLDAPKVDGMDGIMSIGPEPVNQPSIGPQPQNEVRDLSGWGIIGKLHPSLLIKDKMVKMYHNRPHDPRYLHLKGYGHLGQTQHSTPKPSSTFGIEEKIFGI